jgi:hypothetical protein
MKTRFVQLIFLAVMLTSSATFLSGQGAGRQPPKLEQGVDQATWKTYLTEARNSAKPSPNRGQGVLSTYTEIDDNPAQPGLPAGSKPANLQALPRTIFNTPNFYQDRKYKMPDGSVVDLWTDPRYYHCNTSRQFSDIWTRARMSGATPDEREASAKWGNCSLGTSVQNIQTPYSFTTAHQHYDALMAEAKARGGLTKPSADWLLNIVTGQYTRGLTSNIGGSGGVNSSLWFFGRALQQPQFLSLLTPEYQTYMLQNNYHESVSNAPQWSATQYYPEALGRWWIRDDNPFIVATPNYIQVTTGIADNMFKHIYVGRTFEGLDTPVPFLPPDVPRIYGATVGFWDGDMLVTWTSSVQGWSNHSSFEYSNDMQVIEVFTSRYDNAGCHLGFQSEAVMYDPKALVKPVRLIQNYDRVNGCNSIGTAFLTDNTRIWDFWQNIWNVNGRNTPKPGGSVIDTFITPQWFDRPWAQNWIYWFEKGWDIPAGFPGRDLQLVFQE